jgi:uncharacterized protein YceH (UPF0502 family)
MLTVLTDIEVRVLGSLVEKQVTTPEYYPLTINSLMLACNQKNNRHPVTAYTEDMVARAVESLREKNLTYVFYGSTSRVPKYKHVMPEVLHLSHPQLALMCVLMLRGSQTIGELRERASRLHEFSSLEEVEETLNSLITREPENLVVRLSRQPGQKEVRFAHLLAGEVAAEVAAAAEEHSPRRTSSQTDRLSSLQEEVIALKLQMEELRQQFEGFKKQFE